jgi:hypothetical protein
MNKSCSLYARAWRSNQREGLPKAGVFIAAALAGVGGWFRRIFGGKGAAPGKAKLPTVE